MLDVPKFPSVVRKEVIDLGIVVAVIFIVGHVVLVVRWRWRAVENYRQRGRMQVVLHAGELALLLKENKNNL